jgi:hypothetical protein
MKARGKTESLVREPKRRKIHRRREFFNSFGDCKYLTKK